MDVLSRRELFKKYSYDLINTDDIEELQNLFEYASGVVIKDEDMANKYETDLSARNSNIYIKACYKQDDYTENQREKLKGMYEETNKYYRWLLNEYNIDPLVSRTAEDYSILTSINKYDNNNIAVLKGYQEELFLKCYKESLFYWNNVTRTKSFQNDDLFRGFSEVYLLFSAIQKYISYRMKNQFDVDTFTKFQCKNYFISNGVDYFDDLPLIFQRRLIKLLNDLQRDKGDDTIFKYIKEILAINNLNIYRYTLAKVQDKDLIFYKIPYEEELNTSKNETYTFEEITENDPYWRASKDEVLYQTFNILDTKYISIEYVVDLIKNGKMLSYFMYLLNDSMLQNKKDNLNTSLKFINTNISTNPIKLYDAIMALYSLFYTYIKNDNFSDLNNPADKIDKDGDGYYLNNNIKEKIIDDNYSNPLIVNIYGYNNYINNNEVLDKIKEINDIVNNINSNINTSENEKEWNNNLLVFLNNSFNLSNFKYSENYTFDTIEDYYYNPYKLKIVNTSINPTIGNLTIKNEFLELANFIRARKIYNTSEYPSYFDSINGYTDTDKNYHKPFILYNEVYKDNLKESLAYLKDLIFNGDLNVEFLSIHNNFKILFKKYIAYCIINGIIETSDVDINNGIYFNKKYDIFYSFMINNDIIYNELLDYCYDMYGYEIEYFNKFVENRHNYDGLTYFIKFINLVQKNFFTSDELYKYRNLLTFLDVFSVLNKEINRKNNLDSSFSTNGLTSLKSKDSSIDINTFMQVFNKNENIRNNLERYIIESNNHSIYKSLKELWNLKFKSDFNFDLYYEFDKIKDYILDNDEELYNFITQFGDFNTDEERRAEIESRILDLSTAIETYVSSNNNIIYNSTFNVIFSKMKDYAKLLIEVFKAYTLDTIYSDNILDFNDPIGETIKIFDEIKDDFIEDFVLESKPEYIDIQDDIRDDNGNLDIKYNLIIRNLISNASNDIANLKDEDLQYLKAYVTIYEENKNLPYAFTDLNPDAFNKKYGKTKITSSIGFDNYSYNYIEESYNWYINECLKRENNIPKLISTDEIQYLIVDDYSSLNGKYTETTYKVASLTSATSIDELNNELSNKYKKPIGYINLGKKIVFLYDSINGVYTKYSSTELIGKNYVVISSVINPVDLETDFVSPREIYRIYKYNDNDDTFSFFLQLPEIRIFENKPYKLTNDMPEGDYNIYYDPYLKGGYANNKYFINPLNNILDKNIDMAVLTKDKDYYNRSYDNRKEKLFYIRDYMPYNFDTNERIKYNDKLLNEIITVSDEDYLKYLDDKQLITNKYIYKIKDDIYNCYIPKEYNISNTYHFDYDEINGKRIYKKYKIDSQDVFSTILKGNEWTTFQLELGKKYFVNTLYKFSDLVNMYNTNENIYSINRIYMNSYFNGKSIQDELDKLLKADGSFGYMFGEDSSGNKYIDFLVKKDRFLLTDILSTIYKDQFTELFTHIGADYGTSNQRGLGIINHPMFAPGDIFDEMTKYRFIFIVNDTTTDITSSSLYKYKYSATTYNKLFLMGYGYGYNVFNNTSARILYEPLRYYYDINYQDKMVYNDLRDNEKIKYAIDINDDNDYLLPEPKLQKEYKTIDKNGNTDDDYLTVFHKYYTTQQLYAQWNKPDSGYAINVNNKLTYVNGYGDFNNIFKSINIINKENNTYTFKYTNLSNEIKAATPNFSLDLVKSSLYGDIVISMDTSDNALDDEKFKLSIPSTINNNAYMLTLYNSIDKPIISTKINIRTNDIVNGKNKFAYIAVKNKGITNYNNSSDRPLLNEMLKYCKELNLKNISNGNSINNITELANTINSFSVLSKFSRGHEYVTDNLVYDENLNYNWFRTFNENKEELSDIDKNKKYYYDYNYAKSINQIESIDSSGILSSSLSDKLFSGHILIYNESNKLIYDSIVGDVSEDFFNKTLSITSKDDSLSINRTYHLVVENVIMNTPTINGDFICNLDIENNNNIDISNKNITYELDKYGNTISLLTCDIIPLNSNCDITLTLSGIIVFETIVEYDFTSENSDKHELMILSPNRYRNFEEWLPSGQMILYNDDYKVDYLSFMYDLHTFDSSKNKKFKVMITSNLINNSPNITVENSPFSIGDYWVALDRFNDGSIRVPTVNITMSFLNRQKIEKVVTKIGNTNYSCNIKKDYDFYKNKWFKSNNDLILKYGNNVLTTDYSKLINIDSINYPYIKVNSLIPSNKYITDITIPSTTFAIGKNSFQGSTINSITLGPLMFRIQEFAFNKSNLEKVYFLNDAISINDDKNIYIPLYIKSNLIFYENSFSYTNNFKNNHFEIKFPYNTYYFKTSAFNFSTINSIDFSNCSYLISLGILSFANNYYLNRRYILNKNGTEYRNDRDELVYEGTAELKDNSDPFKYKYVANTNNFNNYDTTVFDETLNPNENYMFSDMKSIKLPHGDNKNIIRLHQGAFYRDLYIRTLDLGNTYAVGQGCFEDCTRLMNLLCPEVVYFGDFFVENTNSVLGNEPYFFGDLITYKGKQYLAYKQTNAYYNNISKTPASVKWRFIYDDGKSYELSFETIKEGDNYYKRILNINNGEGKAYLQGSKLTENKIYSGFRNEVSSVTVSSNHGASCKNCASLINIEFNNKLFSISDLVFENAGKLRTFNNFIYIKDTLNNIRNLGYLYEDSNSYSIKGNKKYLKTFYDPERIQINWKLIAIEDENNIYNDAFNIYYHGTLEEFEKVHKKVNWNARQTTNKFKNVSIIADKRINSPYERIHNVPNLNEMNEDFTDHNYFALTMDDSELYFDSVDYYTRTKEGYILDNSKSFDLYRLDDFENISDSDNDELKKLKAISKYSYDNFDLLLDKIKKERDAANLKEREKSNEFYRLNLSESESRFPNRYYLNTTINKDIYKNLIKNYFKDLTFFKFKENILDKNNTNIWKVTIKSKIKKLNNQDVASRNFILGYNFYNEDLITFENDKYTGYYSATFNNSRTNSITNLFNESINDLIQDTLSDSNPLISKRITYSYGYGYDRIYDYNHPYPNTQNRYANNYESNQFEKLDETTHINGNGGRCKNASSFEALVNMDSNTLLTPKLINYATSYQHGGWGNLAYGMLGWENPRGSFNAETSEGLAFYNIESTIPLKSYEDSDDNYLLVDDYPILLKDCDINNTSSDYYTKIRSKYDFITRYTSKTNILTIPTSTINISIDGEDSNSYENKFSFIYRIIGVLLNNNNEVIGFRINGWNDELDEYTENNLFSNYTDVYNEDIYSKNSNLIDTEFEMNNKIYHLHDIYSDLIKTTDDSDKSNITIAYSGGIRRINANNKKAIDISDIYISE